MKINIVCFNMSKYSDWTDSGVVNRNYHILHTLAKDERVNKIIAVDFMPFTWKRAFKTFLIDQVKKDRRGELVYGDLTTQVWQITSKIHVFSTIDSMFNKHRITSELKRVIDELEMQKNLVVYNFNPMYTGYFDKLGQDVNLFDAVDNWSTHSSYKRFKKRLERNYKKIADNSDFLYCVSQDMVEFLDTPKAKWLPNAVDFDHFQKQEVIDEISNKPQPILGFLGILQDRIDVELLKKIAKKYEHATLVLAGPVWKNFPKDEFDGYDNVVFAGPVAYRNIPKFYNTFDVGLITYKNNDFIKSTNSMKYYEYLAAGLPVVTTASGGVEKFKDVMYVAHDHDEFLQLIDVAINEHSVQKEAQRKEFVKDMTWRTRIQEVINDIYTKL